MKIGHADVARIGLGTNRLADTPENQQFVREAVEAGVALIDTAHTYARGDSEHTIGAALSPTPDGVLVATKGGWNGARPQTLRTEIEESLRRLHTDAIDLYYLHRPDPQTPLEESVGAIKQARDDGKVRQVGVSNVTVDQVERARQVVEIAAVQNHFNLSERGDEDVVDYCAREGIVFVPYYPLHGDGGQAVGEIAERHDATAAQVMLAWLLRRSPTMLPIPGTLSIEHVRENLGALDLQLTDEEFEALG